MTNASLFPIFGTLYFMALEICLYRCFRQVTVSKISARWIVFVAFAFHTSFVGWRVYSGLEAFGAPVSNWFDWWVVAAWIAAASYLIWAFTDPQPWQGLLILPSVVGLLVLACGFRQTAVFAAVRAYRIWGAVHGMFLLMGTVTVACGFSAGVMYLIQSSRLKRKLPPLRGMRLPSLESLGRINDRLLVWSAFFLTTGLLAGWILNVAKPGASGRQLPWSDPTVSVSLALFVWLVASTSFSLIYKPVRQSRKVAYLTVASFIVLALTLSVVLFGPSSHASSRDVGQRRAPTESNERPIARMFQMTGALPQ